MRSRVVALSVSLLFASLLTASLLAQAQPAAAPKNEPNVPAILATMKSDLRNVVVAEEMFYSKNTKYTNSLSDAKFTPSPGVYVMVFRADKRGWAGRAVHSAHPGKSCVIWVGEQDATNPVKTDATGASGREGEPVCDS